MFTARIYMNKGYKSIVFTKISIPYKIVYQYLVDDISASKSFCTLSCNTYFKNIQKSFDLDCIWVDQNIFHCRIDVRVFHIFYHYI